eukprot:UN31610
MYASFDRMGFINNPTILIFFPQSYSFPVLYWTISIGLICSICLITFSSHWLLLFICFFSLLSVVNTGGIFTGYGWHSQFIEYGFYCIFLGQSSLIHKWLDSVEPCYYILLGLRFITFRILFEPGVGKISGGDPSWWPNLTAMEYHYWTQPSCNTLSW